jgi:hypothetical protein
VIKKYLLKILTLFPAALLLHTLQSCNQDSNDFIEPPPPPNIETGMWFVGQLNTHGDARYIKGRIINGMQYAFLADGSNGLQIIDITNASNPSLTFNYNTSGNVREVYIDSVNGNEYAFISDLNKGLFILNVTNPSNPFLDTNIAFPGGVNSVNMKNGFLYTGLTQGIIKVLNVNSLPGTINEVFSYYPVNPVQHIETSGNTLFLVKGSAGLEIADITNPSSPSFLSAFQSQGSCSDIKIAGNLGYIADGNAGICIMNAGNPSQPYFVSQTNTHTNVIGLDYSPNFLFAAEYRDGADVFNLFNPVEPEAFGYYVPQGDCYSVNYFKGKVLIANGQNGLLILRF